MFAFRRWFRWVLIGLVIAGCTTVPETGRQQLNLLSSEQAFEMGVKSFEKMKKEVPISDDPEANKLLKKVGKRIAEVADPDIPNAEWEFVVFKKEEPNAFALPGGKVGIHTGILPITKNESGLATVIGHEVAHVAARHGSERVSHALLRQAGGSFIQAGLSGEDPRLQKAASTVYGLGSQLALALPHSRKQEAEADKIGLMYMARAGYNPERAIDFWQRFAEYNETRGSSTPWFLRTHPLDKTRIQNIRDWLPEAKREYRAAQQADNDGASAQPK